MLYRFWSRSGGLAVLRIVVSGGFTMFLQPEAGQKLRKKIGGVRTGGPEFLSMFELLYCLPDIHF
jgi:hypothetical protein